jgi:hypothetical protein
MCKKSSVVGPEIFYRHPAIFQRMMRNYDVPIHTSLICQKVSFFLLKYDVTIRDFNRRMSNSNPTVSRLDRFHRPNLPEKRMVKTTN